MMHPELCNLVICGTSVSWVELRELEESCNLAQLIIPSHWSKWIIPQMFLLYREWAKKIANEERPETKLSLRDYANQCAREMYECLDLLKSNPGLLLSRQTATRILNLFEDEGKIRVRSCSCFKLGKQKWHREAALSRMLNDKEIHQF